MPKKPKSRPKVKSLTRWEFGDYIFRVGDLWDLDSNPIAIGGIYLHMFGNREWHTLEYYYLDQSKGSYITDNVLGFTKRVKRSRLV